MRVRYKESLHGSKCVIKEPVLTLIISKDSSPRDDDLLQCRNKTLVATDYCDVQAV